MKNFVIESPGIAGPGGTLLITIVCVFLGLMWLICEWSPLPEDDSVDVGFQCLFCLGSWNNPSVLHDRLCSTMR